MFVSVRMDFPLLFYYAAVRRKVGAFPKAANKQFKVWPMFSRKTYPIQNLNLALCACLQVALAMQHCIVPYTTNVLAGWLFLYCSACSQLVPIINYGDYHFVKRQLARATQLTFSKGCAIVWVDLSTHKRIEHGWDYRYSESFSKTSILFLVAKRKIHL